MYLYYTLEPTGSNASSPKTSRLTRIQINPDDTIANPISPEKTVVGGYSPTLLSEACPCAGLRPGGNWDKAPASTTFVIAG
ncbi:MAG: hypothetical protein WKF96_07045 [Solirubrobacteraceae bacterium]